MFLDSISGFYINFRVCKIYFKLLFFPDLSCFKYILLEIKFPFLNLI